MGSNDADEPLPSSPPNVPDVRIIPSSDAPQPSEHLVPDSALASSPVLKDTSASSPLNVMNDRFRSSKVSSFRFSKDLDDIRWDGSSLREDDSMFRDEGEDQEQDQDDEIQITEDEGPDSKKSKAEISNAAYSTLSKRADFILANAKKKLNLLEGNLGRARHSLVTPTTTTEFRSSSSLSSYATPASSDEDDQRPRTAGVRIPPRINFAPSRQARAATVSQLTGAGHNRMYSDTSVPPPGGGVIKGSRSLDQVRGVEAEGKNPLRPNLERSGSSNSLGPVPEDEPSSAEKRSSILALRELYGATSPPKKSSKELRDQAEELRGRIAFLQKRSQDDPARYGISAHDPNFERNEEAFQRQVMALQKSLEDQEAVIEELEDAERSAELDNDPRREWHQVLDHSENKDSGSEFSEDDEEDDVGLYDNGEMPDALEDEEDPDDSKTMAGAHEDREDAFDYEHFILHSTMGRYKAMMDRSPSVTSDEGSESSGATAQGQKADEAREKQADAGAWNEFQQPNASMASLTTQQSFETAQERGDSESEDGSYTSDHQELLHSDNPWPMPPGSSHASQLMSGSPQRGGHSGEEDEPSTPTAPTFAPPPGEDKGVQHDAVVRPVSTIYAALTSPENEKQIRAMQDQDSALVRETIESLRSVCLNMNSGDKRTSEDVKGLRERLIVARRILDGEL